MSRNVQDMSSRGDGNKCWVILVKTICILKLKIFEHCFITNEVQTTKLWTCTHKYEDLVKRTRNEKEMASVQDDQFYTNVEYDLHFETF